MEKLSLMDFDSNPNAVLNPNRESLGCDFADKLVYPFVTDEDFQTFLADRDCRIAANFETFAYSFSIYQVQYHNQTPSLVRPPLDTSAAAQLLNWLTAYGVKEVLAIGSCGALTSGNEGDFFLPTKALRDEGTSFHYPTPSHCINLVSPLVTQVKEQLGERSLPYTEVTTWTAGGFFRETKAKVEQRLAEGVSVVEMERAAVATCCQLRQVQFVQILYSTDSLANFEHDTRNWGQTRQKSIVSPACNILAAI